MFLSWKWFIRQLFILVRSTLGSIEVVTHHLRLLWLVISITNAHYICAVIISNLIILWTFKQTFYLIVFLFIAKDLLHYFTLISVRNNRMLLQMFLFDHLITVLIVAVTITVIIWVSMCIGCNVQSVNACTNIPYSHTFVDRSSPVWFPFVDNISTGWQPGFLKESWQQSRLVFFCRERTTWSTIILIWKWLRK